MAGADQPEDLRCSCKTKFAVVTEKAITIGCRGCDQPLILPFAVLTGGKASVVELSEQAATAEETVRNPSQEASTKVNVSNIGH
jgi:hypothetical protein